MCNAVGELSWSWILREKFEKRKRNSPWYVHVVDKTLRGSRAVKAKKCTKKCPERAKLLFCLS